MDSHLRQHIHSDQSAQWQVNSAMPQWQEYVLHEGRGWHLVLTWHIPKRQIDLHIQPAWLTREVAA